MWNLHWTGVRLPSPPLMKTKVILLSLYLLVHSINMLQSNEVFQFLADGRPKAVKFCTITFMFTHIEVEVIKPEIKKDHAAFQYINIYIFGEKFQINHTIHWRYIKFIEA